MPPFPKEIHLTVYDDDRPSEGPLEIGDRVTVVRGPLQGFDGKVLLVDTTRRRSLVEIPAHGRRRRVILNNSALAKPGG